MSTVLIGIPAALVVNPETGLSYYRPYANIVRSVVHAGGLPVLIPADLPEDAARVLYDRVHGVLIPGGGDVNPRHYGAAPHPLTQPPDDARDALELHLARWAVEDDRALLGICRGHQIINVAFGGTLVQDIRAQLETDITHDQPNVPQGRVTLAHDVTITGDSHLARVLDTTRVRVNSLHHQSVDRHAPGLHVTAHAPDGVVEALEVPGKRFALSVQWHPEDLYPEHSPMKRLFEAFVAAARDTRF